MKNLQNLLQVSQSRCKTKKNPDLRPLSYIFCDKKTGAARFQIDADSTGGMPVDRAASLLAIHCLAHHRSPEDFHLVYATGENLIESVVARAGNLMAAAGLDVSLVALSRREREVLAAVSNNLANKEIASLLCLSERTVKFHVSSLLAKFGVNRRGELVRFAGQETIAPGWQPVLDPDTDESSDPVRNVFLEEPQKFAESSNGAGLFRLPSRASIPAKAG
ncbi:MAG: helix-turn-helix transcriptional regulator [Candidatus Acidiferrales bacterium]